MEILHVSAECYPVAKAGGLADVVGALPKYQNQLGHYSKVVMPMHKTAFLHQHAWDLIYKGYFDFDGDTIRYTIIKEKSNVLGFELYCVDVFGLLDREKIYGYADDHIRFLVFQRAVTDWLMQWESLPDVVHVHDYHAGLIPFFMKHGYDYQRLNKIKTVLTVHNAQYQGWMNWSNTKYFPEWDNWKAGLLEWNNQINPLASAVKCVDKVTTVSESYMKALFHAANGLENLFAYESKKCLGIINGIDFKVWNPQTDDKLFFNYSEKNIVIGKQNNKENLCAQFGFDASLPLIIFIGRLVGEKAADLLPESIKLALAKYPAQFNFLVLGNGEPHIETELNHLQSNGYGYFNTQIAFNETLSHQMYAGADFLLMPSRVEPCGLNQLYALRYGTMPIVRRTGGLKDTVTDIGDADGFGICFEQASVKDIVDSIGRAIHLYQNTTAMLSFRKKMMHINHSWENSAEKYIKIYQTIS
jgi:starch synthase